MNENENKLTKSDLKKIEEFENLNIKTKFEEYKSLFKDYYNELKLCNKILVENIEEIVSEIKTIEKQISEDEENFDKNIENISNNLLNFNSTINQFNELKQDIQDIKHNDNIIEDLKKRIQILESKI